jgi:hypothetical protein
VLRAFRRQRRRWESPDVGAVVEQGKRQRQRVGVFADGDALVAGVAEHAPGPLGERLTIELCQRFRRAEAATATAGEQHAGQALIRQGSV